MKINKKLGTATFCLLIALTVVIATADCPTKKEYRSMVKEATKDYFTNPTPEKLIELQSMLKTYATGDFTKCEKAALVNKTETNKILLQITDIDKILAEQTLETAENTPTKNPKKYEKTVKQEIQRAKEWLTKANKKAEEGEYDKAIDNYKKSWEHSQQAIKFANK